MNKIKSRAEAIEEDAQDIVLQLALQSAFKL